MATSADMATALRLAGVSEEQIEKAVKLFPPKTRRIKVDGSTCPACGSKALRGDFVCGTCSEVKAGSNRRFWQLVDDRERGLVGRPIYGKPEPQQLPAQTPTPLKHKIVSLPDELPAVEIVPERREYLVTCGLVGRVIVATSAARAARVAHVLNGDGETTGHSVLCLGLTTLEETEAVPEKTETKIAPVVERVFRIQGPGYERELKLATVASSNRV